MAAFVGAGALAGNATVTPQAISSHASTAVGDLLICQLINKSVTANAVTPPDGTWTKIVESTNNASTAGHRHQFTLFQKVATLAGAQNYTFTKATDDNVLFAGVISTWRAAGLDATALGTTVTTAGADNVTFPAFDPTSTSAHVIYFAWYGLAATTFPTMSGTNPSCLTRYDLESATGTACTLACTSGNSDGASIVGRTWASASSVDAGNTGVVLALVSLETIPVTQAAATAAGKTVTIREAEVTPVTNAIITVFGKPLTEYGLIPVNKATISLAGQSVTIADVSAPGSDDVRFASTRTRLNVRRTLLYRPLTASIRVVTTETIPITPATVTVTGKTVTGLDTGGDTTVVTSATVTFAGQTVSLTEPISDLIPQAETELLARWTLLYRPLTAPVPILAAAVVDIIPVTAATVTVTGQTVSIGEGTPPGNDDVRFATSRTAQTARRELLYRLLTVPPVVTPPEFTFTSRTSARTSRKALLYPSLIFPPILVTAVTEEFIPVFPAAVLFTGKSVTIRDADVTPVAKATVLFVGKTVTVTDLVGTEIIPVNPAAIRFTGQEVTLTGQGEVRPPTGGGGGVTVPPWIDYGRKQRRRYRALEEIERRLDKRIEALKTEKIEKQAEVQQAFVATPDFQQNLFTFEQLLAQQMAITQALLEAQRRAELVRQERIQLAILAQRAAEAIDEEEAITMLLLT